MPFYLLIMPNYQPEIEGKQLSDRVSVDAQISWPFLKGLLGVDLSALGESKLRLKSCLIAEIKCTVGFEGGLEDLNFSQKFMCRFRASSVLINLSDRKTSSFTASAQSPQIHLPWFLSRTLSMYSGVHSSVNPQHSHFANSISIWATSFAAVCWVSGPEIITESVSTVADIAENPAEADQTKKVFPNLLLNFLALIRSSLSLLFPVSFNLFFRLNEKLTCQRHHKTKKPFRLCLSVFPNLSHSVKYKSKTPIKRFRRTSRQSQCFFSQIVETEMRETEREIWPLLSSTKFPL